MYVRANKLVKSALLTQHILYGEGNKVMERP